MFVMKKQNIVKTLLTLNTSPLSIILLSPVKKSSRLNQERNMHWSSTVYKWKQSKTVFWILMWEDNTGWAFSLLSVMDYGLGQKQWFKVKMPYWWICFLQTHSFLLHKTLFDRLEWCGLLVMFLSAVSFWRHPFTVSSFFIFRWTVSLRGVHIK